MSLRGGLLSILLVAAMAIDQNAYFGWNLTPKSDAELISDLMILGFSLIAAVIISKEN